MENKSVPRLEMELDELKDEMGRQEAKSKSFNLGCLVFILALLFFAVEPFTGTIILIISFIAAYSQSRNKRLARERAEEIQGEITEMREEIVSAKEAEITSK